MKKQIRPKIDQRILFKEVKRKRDDILVSESTNATPLPTRDIGSYGEYKLSILRQYLYAYSTIVSNNFPQYYYLETCAGPGVCKLRNSGQLVLGTSLLAMTNKPAFTKYVFVEIDEPFYAALKKRKNTYCPDVDAEIIRDDCNNCIRPIIESLPWNKPVFVVMDPEGLELKWDARVVPIANHPRSELFINFPYNMAIKRCISENVYSRTEETVTDYLGTDQWKHWRNRYVKGEISHDERRSALLEIYKEGLQNLGLTEIQVSRIIRSDNNQPSYFLISASRKRVARKIMKDIMKVDVTKQTTIANGD